MCVCVCVYVCVCVRVYTHTYVYYILCTLYSMPYTLYYMLYTIYYILILHSMQYCSIIYVYIHIHVYMYICICIYMCIYIYMYTCMYVHVNACMHTYSIQDDIGLPTECTCWRACMRACVSEIFDSNLYIEFRVSRWPLASRRPSCLHMAMVARLACIWQWSPVVLADPFYFSM